MKYPITIACLLLCACSSPQISKESARTQRDQCIELGGQKGFFQCKDKLKNYSSANDLDNFQKLWKDVCDEPTFQLKCRNIKVPQRGATSTMLLQKGERDSAFRLRSFDGDAVIFFFGPKEN